MPLDKEQFRFVTIYSAGNSADFASNLQNLHKSTERTNKPDLTRAPKDGD
jgi:hypothetical protein